MPLGRGWPRGIPRLRTLYTGRMPGTASTSHAAWDVDRPPRRPSGETAGSRGSESIESDACHFVRNARARAFEARLLALAMRIALAASGFRGVPIGAEDLE